MQTKQNKEKNPEILILEKLALQAEYWRQFGFYLSYISVELKSQEFQGGGQCTHFY